MLPGQTADVFTTARPTIGAAINDFLSRPPTPVQPVEFPPGRPSALYDPGVSDGKILVGIEHPPDGAIPELETALGAVREALVKTI